MAHYVHHIPGRLRLKFEQIRKQPGLAAIIEKEIGNIAGVSSVQARVITGSLLIRYDAALVDDKKILTTIDRRLRDIGLTLAHEPHAADAIADKLVGMVVSRCLERSAIMLLGALL